MTLRWTAVPLVTFKQNMNNFCNIFLFV
jgi:hypothetical protein